MPELPDDVIELLRQIRKVETSNYDDDDLPHRIRVRATELLEAYGVQVKTTEEELRDRVAELQRENGRVRFALAAVRREKESMAEMHNQRGMQINHQHAKIQELSAARRAADAETARYRAHFGDLPGEVKDDNGSE